MTIDDSSFERVEVFKCLKKYIKSKFFSGKIKSRLNSWNVCYRSVPNLLPCNLLSKNIKLKIYRIVILLFSVGVIFGSSR